MKKIISLVLAMATCFVLFGCGVPADTSTETLEKEPVNVYADENISVDFIKITNSILEGNFELYIKTQNKTDKAVTVYLKDVSINGSMVQVGSGVPCDIIAGVGRTHAWTGRLDLAGVTSADEVETITFKVWLVDEEMNTLITTPDLEVKK